MLDDERVKRLQRAASVLTRLTGLVTASVLASGCSLLPFGRPAAPEADRAMRPQLHEVAANREPDCIATTAEAESANGASGAPGSAVASERHIATSGAGFAPAAAPHAVAAAAGCAACACRGDAGVSMTTTPVPPAEFAHVTATPTTDAEPADRAEVALQRLMDGNKRFVEGEAENVYRLPARPGAAAAARRKPAAMLLACSDWDLPPEAAFDALPGELFVVRVAGHVADGAVVDSARYAVRQHDVPLIIVLGHENCGAVGGGIDFENAVEGRTAGHKVGDGSDADGRADVDAGHGHDDAELAGEATAPLDVAIHGGVNGAVSRLRRVDPVLARRIDAGKLRVVGAYYDETNGQITLQPERPPVTPMPRFADAPRD